MTIGSGIAVTGIWLGVGLCAFAGIDGGPIVLIAGCAMLATLFTKV